MLRFVVANRCVTNNLLQTKCKPAMMLPIKMVFGLIAVALTLAACSPLRAINALTPASTYIKTADVPYGARPRQKLDVYTPAGTKSPAPVVVFFYGGSWNSGERPDYEFAAEALASRGMVAILPDYRLYPEVRYPDFLIDSAQAVSWAAKEASRYGGDPKRLFVMGHSAGAYNAAMVALDKRWLGQFGMAPEILRGWIGLAGPYNFLPIQNPDVKPVFFHPNTPPESQPVNHVAKSAPPALLIAPQSDDLVNPARNTGRLAQVLRENDVPVTEIYFDRVNHITLVGSLSRPLRHFAPTLDAITRFVEKESAQAKDPA
jgi:acetyl esterase/lipase